MADGSIGYEAFLREKIRLAPLSGFECEAHEINPLLKPHQRDIVQWVVRGYRAILSGRKGAASELNTGYFRDGVQYLQAAERQISIPDLFGIAS